jgi:hypothetical protein
LKEVTAVNDHVIPTDRPRADPKDPCRRRPRRQIRYRIDTAPVHHNGELIDYTGRFTAVGVSEKSVADILTTHHRDSAQDFTPAQRFILAYVAGHGDQDGEVPCVEVIKAGEPAGYEERDLIKARNKSKHRVGTRKDGMKGGCGS